MDAHETTATPARRRLDRRTVLKGAAWSVPAVVAVGATPAFAATDSVPPSVSITSISADKGNLTLQGTIGVAPGDLDAVLTNVSYKSVGQQERTPARDLPSQTITVAANPDGTWELVISGASNNTRYVFTIIQSDESENTATDSDEITL